MKNIVLLLLGIFIFPATMVQGQKKAPVHFSIKQDDDQKDLFIVDVPSGSEINTIYNFALYERGKSSLTVNYVLDDDPESTVRRTERDNNIDLLKYSREVPATVLAGTTDITITNKTVAAAMITYNGFQTVKLTYDYSHVISGANVTETGKVVLYVIKVNGSSMVNTDEHNFIVRLKFNYQQNGADDLSKLDAQIIGTIKKATD